MEGLPRSDLSNQTPIRSHPRRVSARSRTGSSSSWDIHLGGCIQREPVRHAWDTGHQRRASNA
jgi:hypothetical protein